ncbi:MAG: hypothetical protein IJ400_06370 [Clostridia bacterium]|nr:hypothetical protein [Clostridia bacterium]
MRSTKGEDFNIDFSQEIICTICGKQISADQEFEICPECISPFHKTCYETNKGCGNAKCSKFVKREKYSESAFDKIIKSIHENADEYLKAEQYEKAKACFHKILELKNDDQEAIIGMMLVESKVEDLNRLKESMINVEGLVAYQLVLEKGTYKTKKIFEDAILYRKKMEEKRAIEKKAKEEKVKKLKEDLVQLELDKNELLKKEKEASKKYDEISKTLQVARDKISEIEIKKQEIFKKIEKTKNEYEEALLSADEVLKRKKERREKIKSLFQWKKAYTAGEIKENNKWSDSLIAFFFTFIIATITVFTNANAFHSFYSRYYEVSGFTILGIVVSIVGTVAFVMMSLVSMNGFLEQNEKKMAVHRGLISLASFLVAAGLIVVFIVICANM